MERIRTMRQTVLCVGELLWDSMPNGLLPGGAPFNVAYHLARLGRPAAIGTRVGDDILGREILRRVAAAGLPDDLVQVDDALETGLVRVTLDPEGTPSYEIVAPVAWDRIEPTAALIEAARDAAALVFGSLAQRDPISRGTIRTLAAASPLAAFDVNLRPPFVETEVIRESLRRAAFVKMNDDELRRLAEWFGWSGEAREIMAALAGEFDVRTVCVTRGADGAVLWREGRWAEHAGYRVEVEDTVGSGDAFLAALLDAILEGTSMEQALDRACRLGAYVATRSGATPDHEDAAQLRADRGGR